MWTDSQEVSYCLNSLIRLEKPDSSRPTSSETNRGRRQSGEPVSGITLSMDILRDWLDQGRPVTVLDVRSSDQHAEWAIPGSVHVDAYEALKAHDPEAVSEIQLPLDRPVVTVCGMGRVSAVAAQQLRDRGYEALSLEGGMKAWSLAWNTAEVPLRNNSARVIQFRRTGKGCLSYLVGSRNEAATIDASLPPEVYLNIATNLGWRITDVLDTHIHADHLSRSRQLAHLTAAALHVPMQGRVTYAFSPVLDGQCVELGEARLTALLTPGHTAESTCYLLDDKVLFTGDTLFLAGVGRPDLEATPEDARSQSRETPCFAPEDSQAACRDSDSSGSRQPAGAV